MRRWLSVIMISIIAAILIAGTAAHADVLLDSVSYPNDFELDNGGWVADPPTGGWEWGVPTYASGPTAHSGTNVWGTVLASTYPNGACFRLTLSPGLPVASASATVEFWCWYNTETSYDGCNFKVSVDTGTTWTTVTPSGGYPVASLSTANGCNGGQPAWAGNSSGWRYVVIPIGQFLGQVPMFRFTFGSDGSVVYPGFFFDDMNIEGLYAIRPCTNLAGNYVAPNVTLNWLDPTQDYYGNPIAIDYVEVRLNAAGTDYLLSTVSPGVQTYTHYYAPTGALTYYVRAIDSVHSSFPVSISINVGSPSYSEDFDVGYGDLMPTPTTDGWGWGVPTATDGPQPRSEPNVWGTVLDGNYTDSACWQLDLAPGLAVTSIAATVEFWCWYATETSYDGCNFKVSVDNGTTWAVLTPTTSGYTVAAMNVSNTCIGGQPAWSGNSQGWQYVVLPIAQFIGQTPIFRLEFGSNASGTTYPGFFFDDMVIWGLDAPNGTPQAATNLAANYTNPNVVLTWTDPTLDLVGNPVTLTNLQVWLGLTVTGQLLGTVNSGVQTFTHINPISGSQTYSVRAYASPHYGPSASATITVPGPYDNDFNTDSGGWVPIPPTGGWSWGSPTNPSAPPPHSAPKFWGTGLIANYHNNADYFLDINPGLVVRSSTATVEFWFRFDTEDVCDGCNFKASTDNGVTWTVLIPSQNGYNRTIASSNDFMAGQPAWSGHMRIEWRRAIIPIGQYLGQAPMFRFEFSSDPAVDGYTGFFFDDMVFWGVQVPKFADIAGTITLVGGEGSVTDVVVRANGDGSPSTHPNIDSTYVLSHVEIGRRTITAELPGYQSASTEVDLDTMGLVGVDLTLTAIPCYNITPQVLSPNGGESWRVFHYDTVRWTLNEAQSLVRIELNRSYPVGSWEVLADSTPNDGEEIIFVTYPVSDSCRVRISILDSACSDISDADFRIATSQGYLALVQPSQPNTPVLSWDAGVQECPATAVVTYCFKNFGTEDLMVLAPTLAAGTHFGVTNECLLPFELAPGQMSPCSLRLTLLPAEDGTCDDTLIIQSDAVNGIGGFVRIPLSGSQITTLSAPQVVIKVSGDDAQLSWKPVTASIGGCPITTSAYLVFYSPTASGPFYFHGPAADTTYTHYGVAQFEPRMFYEVVTYVGPLSAVVSLPDNGTLTVEELLYRLQIHEDAARNRESTKVSP